MECLALTALFLVVFVFLPFGRMLFGTGPNNWRRLVRLDLAALIVFITGIAVALAIVRGMDWPSAVCLLTFVLPTAIAFVWLGRFLLEDISRSRSKTLRESNEPLDFSNLSREPQEVSQSEPRVDDSSLKPPDPTPGS